MQTQWRFVFASWAVPSWHFGNSSCSFWTSGPGSDMLSSPGVQPYTLARRNVARHSQCGISSDQRGRPHPPLYDCDHGVRGTPSSSVQVLVNQGSLWRTKKKVESPGNLKISRGRNVLSTWCKLPKFHRHLLYLSIFVSCFFVMHFQILQMGK